ncbi:hypothetical protein D3C76_783850 [compost metagenome]
MDHVARCRLGIQPFAHQPRVAAGLFRQLLRGDRLAVGHGPVQPQFIAKNDIGQRRRCAHVAHQLAHEIVKPCLVHDLPSSARRPSPTRGVRSGKAVVGSRVFVRGTTHYCELSVSLDALPGRCGITAIWPTSTSLRSQFLNNDVTFFFSFPIKELSNEGHGFRNRLCRPDPGGVPGPGRPFGVVHGCRCRSGGQPE